MVEHYLFLLFGLWLAEGHVAQTDAFHVIGNKGRTIVCFLCAELDILKGDAFCMAQIKAPSRQFFKLGELRIRLAHFRNTVKLAGCRATESIVWVATSGCNNLYVAQGYILNLTFGNAYDAGR